VVAGSKVLPAAVVAAVVAGVDGGVLMGGCMAAVISKEPTGRTQRKSLVGLILPAIFCSIDDWLWRSNTEIVANE
jgi:hypothetical protein